MSRKNKVTCQWCMCKHSCLGPLTFHSEVKGQHVKLSKGGRRATRNPTTFRHGVTFSSRPVQVKEKVRMRVERCVRAWHGALRVGFTSVPPGTGPMCSLTIPDLTEQRGFWAVPVPEKHCPPGTELTFWVTSKGYLRIQTDGFDNKVIMSQIDTSKPIWALIDVYGQTSAVLFLGSEKKIGLFGKCRSCAAPKISAEYCGYDRVHEKILEKRASNQSLDVNPLSFQSQTDDDYSCIVCFSKPASEHLDCGHCCMCSPCTVRVTDEFGTCPLCRQCIRS